MCRKRNVLQLDIDRNLLGNEGCNSIIFEVSWEDDGGDEHINFVNGSWFNVIDLKD